MGFICLFSGQFKSNYYFQSSIVDGATRNMAFPNIYILGKHMLLLIHSIFTCMGSINFTTACQYFILQYQTSLLKGQHACNQAVNVVIQWYA